MNNVINVKRAIIIKEMELLQKNSKLSETELEFLSLLLHYKNEFDETLLNIFLNLFKKVVEKKSLVGLISETMQSNEDMMWIGNSCCG